MAPWADEPFALIQIHKLTSKNADALFIGKDMANAHNNMIRALNSMYNQAPYVNETKDVADLLLYASFWIDWIEREQAAQLLLRGNV